MGPVANEGEVPRMAEKKVSPAKPASSKATKSTAKATATRVTKKKHLRRKTAR